MKNFLILLMISMILFSCGGRKVNKKTARNIIGGEWILKSYVDELKATGSPYKAGEKLKGITEMKIVTDVYDRNDSINVVAIVNNHEGYSFKLFLEKTSDAIMVKAFPNEIANKDIFEIRFDINNDSVIKLVTFDEKGNIIESVDYLKVSRESDANANLTIADLMSMRIVFGGDFRLFDNNNKELSQVSFYSTGSVKGFPGYKNYRLLNDFIASGVEFDYLMLSNDSKSFMQEKEFGLKRIQDRIELYSVVTDSTEFFVQMDKLAYILKRK
jgi:hypothetical protein